MSPIPARIRAAIGLLDPRPGEHLLEVGCGTGQGLAALLAAEPGARVTAIDRSATAVARARVVNAASIEAGRAEVLEGDIEKRAPAGRFDRVFCIRVNSFWTRPGLALPHVGAAFAGGGSLWAMWDGREDKVAGPFLASLADAGWHAREVAAPGAWGIVARP